MVRTFCMSLTYEEKIPDVLAGICDSTLRPQVGMSRGRKIGKRSKRQVGDQLLLHGWKGVPYRSAWSFKVLAEIYKMMPALISYRGAVIRSDEGMINYQWEELDWLAKIDGIRPATGLQMNKNLKQWELRIAHEAQAEAAKVNWKFGPEDAYTIAADFKFQLPKSRPRKWRHQHTVKPDLDKVLRALNDALTNILISDDSQIVNAEVGKSYCEGDEQPGLYVALEKFPGRMLR